MVMWVAAAAAVAGAVVQSKGAKAEAKGAATAANYNARIADRNAKVADIQAEQTLLINKIESQTAAERFRDLQSSLNVAYAKSGVLVGSGTARLVEEENAREFDEEQAARLMIAESEAQSFREKGVNQRLEGNLQRISARNYLTAGRYKSQAALIGGVSKGASLLSGA